MLIVYIILALSVPAIAYYIHLASIAASESKVKIAELQTQAAREQAAADLTRAEAEKLRVEQMRLDRV